MTKLTNSDVTLGFLMNTVNNETIHIWVASYQTKSILFNFKVLLAQSPLITSDWVFGLLDVEITSETSNWGLAASNARCMSKSHPAALLLKNATCWQAALQRWARNSGTNGVTWALSRITHDLCAPMMIAHVTTDHFPRIVRELTSHNIRLGQVKIQRWRRALAVATISVCCGNFNNLCLDKTVLQYFSYNNLSKYISVWRQIKLKMCSFQDSYFPQL